MFASDKREGEAAPDLGTLRVDRLLMLADEIEKPTRGWVFDMDQWNWPYGDCGTACCIGGHAQLMFTRDTSVFCNVDAGGSVKVSDALGLTFKQASRLFFPWNHGGPGADEVDRSRAARVLRHLAATGRVDWTIA